MIILDTNVLSELMKPKPARAVLRWLASQPGSSLYTTTITQAEVLYGMALLPKGKRRNALEEAVNQMFAVDFAGRILPFDCDGACAFARVAAERRRAGNPISQCDAMIAAIAVSRGAGIATRNVSDFQDCGLALFDPWRSPK